MKTFNLYHSTNGKNANRGTDIRLFFDINNSNYQIVNDLSTPVDFFVDCNSVVSGKVLDLDIFHNYENQLDYIQKKLAKYQNHYVITNAFNDEYFVHDTLINIDFLFNRTKAYYEQYPLRSETMAWYHHGQLAFINNQIKSADQRQKIFVAPNKTYGGTKKYRTQLVEKLKSFANVGYIGNYDDSKTFLYPHIEFPYENDISVIENQTRPLSYNYFGFLPPHNAYYDNTFISIYGETVEFGNTYAVTEKTYTPLIKGHFVLPFSCQGFVRQLKRKGIQLPDFIDYSYDNIDDNDKRFEAYSNEVVRLLNLDLDTWKQHYDDNIELIYQNKLWFSNTPYDRVDLSNLI
jgi:hypothetical protein